MNEFEARSSSAELLPRNFWPRVRIWQSRVAHSKYSAPGAFALLHFTINFQTRVCHEKLIPVLQLFFSWISLLMITNDWMVLQKGDQRLDLSGAMFSSASGITFILTPLSIPVFQSLLQTTNVRNVFVFIRCPL